MLIDEIDALVAQLTELRRPVVQWLVPGIDSGQLESMLGTPVPDEVSTWFAWCNGVELRAGQTQGDVNIIPGYNPLSISEAIDQMADHHGDVTLGPHWIPLLGGASGDIYAAVWESNEPAKVAGVLVGEATEIEFQSIEHMVATFNECYRRGAFFIGSNGNITMNPDLYERIISDPNE